MKLVDNASKWWRMHSVQALGAITTLQGIGLAAPESVLEMRVPFAGGLTFAGVNMALTILAAVLGVVGRLVKQDEVSAPKADGPA